MNEVLELINQQNATIVSLTEAVVPMGCTCGYDKP